MSEKARVQINYRSGISMVVECDEFTIIGPRGQRRIEWENAVPAPMTIGVEDIESVWQLGDEE